LTAFLTGRPRKTKKALAQGKSKPSRRTDKESKSARFVPKDGGN